MKECAARERGRGRERERERRGDAGHDLDAGLTRFAELSSDKDGRHDV